MKTIHILTKGFDSPNSYAFLYPLILYKHALYRDQIELKFFKSIKKSMYDCDVLLTESKFFSTQWSQHTEKVLATFVSFKEKIKKVYYVDINDSSGWPHARVLPYVDGYFKNQLLKDKSLYLTSFYAHRIYADFYHKKYQVHDKSPLYSEVVTHPALLQKLHLSWNSGLANYSLRGPYRSLLYKKIPLQFLLSFPKNFIMTNIHRNNDVSCRMGITYPRESVAWQRRQIRKILHAYIPTNKVSRKQYYQELLSSKIVISPFGLGEITLKDFEVFLTGGLLIKPDMSHMETWPNFYRNNDTLLMHHWDLTDLTPLVEEVLSHYRTYIDIAHEGQEYYRHYLSGPHAYPLFRQHFLGMLNV